MSENSLSRYHAQLFVSLLMPLQQHGNHFLPSLDKFEVLLLSELKTGDFVMEYANEFLHIWALLILNHVGLVTESDAPEEFGHDHFVAVVFS